MEVEGGGSCQEDMAILIPTSQLAAERERGVDKCMGDMDWKTQHRGSKRGRPKPGHYPLGFSPWRLEEKRGISVPKAASREDLQVMSKDTQPYLDWSVHGATKNSH